MPGQWVVAERARRLGSQCRFCVQHLSQSPRPYKNTPVYLDEPSVYLDEPPVYLDEPLVYLDEPSVYLDKTPVYLDNVTVHPDDPIVHLDASFVWVKNNFSNGGCVMSNQSFSQYVSNFRTMASGITTRLASLSGVGIVAADATAMNSYADQLDALNAEQEDLKAQLKAKTDAMNKLLKEAKAKNADLTKRVKIVIAQEEWVAFGVAAKR